ncbi:MAG: D-2-hydroxyacid dehydrogenase [Clostridia bacterium]|nr:D-2-hydroxyacid dehydrogenase [Clostridia bacterium]
MKKLLITGAWRYTDEQYEALIKMGYEITLMPDERGALPRGAEDAEVIVCNGLFLYHDLDLFPNLRVVQLTSAGLDRVPMEKMRERGIEVFNARGVYSVPMAEYALFGVLFLYKQSRFFDAAQSAHEWKKHRGILEICGKRVLIVGAGSVGSECAARFSAFGARVRGIDLYPRVDESYEEIASLDCLKDELAGADIIVLTLPLTAETRHLINGEALSCVKPEAVLVNIARGAVVDTEALVSALRERRLFGAVLDVFEEEPLLPESPLWDMENVIVTPHNSFVGDGNGKRLFGVIKNNLERIL